jgi:hypothetical protein
LLGGKIINMVEDGENEEELLDRFSADSRGPQSTVTAQVDGVWWTDEDRGASGKMTIEIEYNPETWLVYPESLVHFLREVCDDAMRPEEAGPEVYSELSELLFGSEVEAEGNLFVLIQAQTAADSYEFQVGELN